MKKTLTMVLALALVFALGVGATLAWLADTTGEVKNTFTPSTINITLEEDVDTDKDNAASFKMVPGATITKDPEVTVLANSEACWLFVEVTKSNNFDTFMEYAMAAGWTAGDGTNIPANVYYREVADTDEDQPFQVLANDQVAVKNTVTKAMMDELTADADTYPTLTFKAYAVQYMENNTENFTAAEAWGNRLAE